MILLDHRLDSHIEASIKRRDPNIQRLAHNYNKLVDTMARLAARRQSPAGAVIPAKIEMKGLLKLDVDDDIWQDIGLVDSDEWGEEGDLSSDPPAWLCDDAVREGIRAMLEYKRSTEEERRLQHECQSLQRWFAEQWTRINQAIEQASELHFYYNLFTHLYILYLLKC